MSFLSKLNPFKFKTFDDGYKGKRPRIKCSKWKAYHYQLEKGYAFNPLLKWPVNHPCWCGSGRKAKKCCQPFLPRAVSVELSATIITLWDELMDGSRTLPGVPKPPAPEKTE